MVVTEAIILAGGRGERLRPLTDDRPKPMVIAGDYPLLYYIVHWLKQFDIKRVVFACGYRHNVISDYFGDGSGVGIEVEYSIEEQPLGRGGGIKLASQKLAHANPVLVINGDVVTNLPLNNLIEAHDAASLPVTIVTTPLRSPYGIIDIDENGLATEFREKPILPYWINAGIYLINRVMLEQFPDLGDHEEGLFPSLAEKGLLKTYQFNGFWSAIDTRKDLEELKKEGTFLAQVRRSQLTIAS